MLGLTVLVPFLPKAKTNPEKELTISNLRKWVNENEFSKVTGLIYRGIPIVYDKELATDTDTRVYWVCWGDKEMVWTLSYQ